MPVSGTFSKGYFDATLTGPEWLSGGVFGVEGSIVVCGLLLGIVLFGALMSMFFGGAIMGGAGLLN